MYPALARLRVDNHARQPGAAVWREVSVLAYPAVASQLQLSLDGGGAPVGVDGAITRILHSLLGAPLGLWLLVDRQPRAHGLYLRLEAVELLPQRDHPLWRLGPVGAGLRVPAVRLACIWMHRRRQNVLPLLPFGRGPQLEHAVRGPSLRHCTDATFALSISRVLGLLGSPHGSAVFLASWVILGWPADLSVRERRARRESKHEPVATRLDRRGVLDQLIQVDPQTLADDRERLKAVDVQTDQARRTQGDAHIPVRLGLVERFSCFG